MRLATLLFLAAAAILAALCPATALSQAVGSDGEGGLLRASHAQGSSQGKDWPKQEFCGEADCPEYTVWQRSLPDYEAREYKEVSWVATVVLGSKLEVAVQKGVECLNRYFAGGNEDKAQLACTLPSAVRYKLGLHPHTGARRNYTVAMSLPYNHQDRAPAPIEEKVFVYKSPQANMFVRMFQEPVSERRVVDEARALGKVLDSIRQPYEAGEVFVAMYGCADSPTIPSPTDTTAGAALDAAAPGGSTDSEEGKKKRARRCRHPHNEVWLHRHGKDAQLL